MKPCISAKNESGSALVQAMVAIVFFLILAYSVGDWLVQRNKMSTRRLDRAIYSGIGEQISSEISDPGIVIYTQTVDSSAAYD